MPDGAYVVVGVRVVARADLLVFLVVVAALVHGRGDFGGGVVGAAAGDGVLARADWSWGGEGGAREEECGEEVGVHGAGLEIVERWTGGSEGVRSESEGDLWLSESGRSDRLSC